MRSKLLLLVLLPTFAYSQSYLTDGEQEKRIAHVSKFCSLLSRWSNGERTLDTQIYNLCSGSNCTAYDEVTTKKETTLRNYLLGIQKNYPQKFVNWLRSFLNFNEMLIEPILNQDVAPLFLFVNSTSTSSAIKTK